MGSKEEHTDKARAMTARRLCDLGNVITIDFIPPNLRNNTWGITASDRKPISWAGKNHPWPQIKREHSDPKYGLCHPVIALKHEFVDFFQNGGYEKATGEQKYRAWFMLASTLVHEVAHAYWRFQRDRKGWEPLWSPYEHTPELGFSLETYMFGRIVEPHVHSILRNQPLACI